MLGRHFVAAQEGFIIQPQSEVISPNLSEAKHRFPKLLTKKKILKPKIALVLSGGGARSIAAIGVLKVLEEKKIPIDLIVGTSMGSTIGGLYAMGYSPEQLQQIVDTTNWDELLSYADDIKRRDIFLDQKITRDKSVLVLRFEGFEPVIPQAFSTGQRLTNYLNLLTLQGLYQPEKNFDDLRIPFRAVTTDLITGKRIVIDRGDMTEAMRASMAVPLLFSSVPLDTLQLLDGGLVDNLPVDVAIEKEADIIIAVDMTSPLRPKDKLNAPWEIADQITTIMMQAANKLARSKAHIVITPDLGENLSSDFTNHKSLISAGEAATIKNIPELINLIEEQNKNKNRQVGDITYNRPKFTNTHQLPNDFQDKIELYKKRGWLNKSEIQLLINDIYNEGSYADVKAEITKYVDSTSINFLLVQNPILMDVLISGNQIFTSETLRKEFDSLIGKPLNSRFINNVFDSLVHRYKRDGYSLARIRDARFDSISNTAIIIVDEGVIYRTDVEGNKKTRAWVLRREVPWKQNEIFTIIKAAQGISNLYGTNYFEQIRLAVRYEGDSNQFSIPTIYARERSAELIRFGLRADNERNIQLSLDVRDENLLGAATEFGFFAGGGSRNQSYICELKSIRIFHSYLTFTLRGYSLIRDINVFSNVLSNASYDIDREIVGEYREIRKGGSISFGTQLERLGSVNIEGRLEKHKLYNIFNNPISNQEYNISSVRFGTYVDNQDKYPYPTDGVVINFFYESALVKLIESVGFTKMYFSYENYKNLFKHHTIRPKIIIGVADETLPLGEHFSLGGQHNFFGYREDDKRGRQILVASLEYQYKMPIKIFFETYLKARYDFGAIWARTEEMRLEDFKHGIGVTIGLDTPIGPAEFSIGRSFYLRKDILNKPLGFGPYLAYFSIGYPITGVIRN